jgi:hypothetical protein
MLIVVISIFKWKKRKTQKKKKKKKKEDVEEDVWSWLQYCKIMSTKEMKEEEEETLTNNSYLLESNILKP